MGCIFLGPQLLIQILCLKSRRIYPFMLTCYCNVTNRLNFYPHRCRHHSSLNRMHLLYSTGFLKLNSSLLLCMPVTPLYTSSMYLHTHMYLCIHVYLLGNTVFIRFISNRDTPWFWKEIKLHNFQLDFFFFDIYMFWYEYYVWKLWVTEMSWNV